jgi:hypothetical protein
MMDPKPPHQVHKGPSREPASGKPRRGRPPELVDPSELSIRMNAELHDRLIQEAQHRGVTPGKLARQLLDQALKRRAH